MTDMRKELFETKIQLQAHIHRANKLEERIAMLENRIGTSSNTCSYPVNNTLSSSLAEDNELTKTYTVICEEMYRSSKLRVSVCVVLHSV
jgi:hypothetical protein